MSLNDALLAASYVQAGVLAWLPHTIRGIVWWITLKLNKVLIYFTLATEMSGYVLCMHWTVFCAATVGLFLLHVGIYVMSGIWFRALALVDLAQAIYIWRLPPARRRRLFSWGLALFCLFYALELHHQDKPGVAVRYVIYMSVSHECLPSGQLKVKRSSCLHCAPLDRHSTDNLFCFKVKHSCLVRHTTRLSVAI